MLEGQPWNHNDVVLDYIITVTCFSNGSGFSLEEK